MRELVRACFSEYFELEEQHPSQRKHIETELYKLEQRYAELRALHDYYDLACYSVKAEYDEKAAALQEMANQLDKEQMHIDGLKQALERLNGRIEANEAILERTIEERGQVLVDEIQKAARLAQVVVNECDEQTQAAFVEQWRITVERLKNEQREAKERLEKRRRQRAYDDDFER